MGGSVMAGQIAGLVTAERTAEEIVRGLVEDAARVLESLRVCQKGGVLPLKIAYVFPGQGAQYPGDGQRNLRSVRVGPSSLQDCQQNSGLQHGAPVL